MYNLLFFWSRYHEFKQYFVLYIHSLLKNLKWPTYISRKSQQSPRAISWENVFFIFMNSHYGKHAKFFLMCTIPM